MEKDLIKQINEGNVVDLTDLCRKTLFSNNFIETYLYMFSNKLDLFRFQELSIETINYILSYCFKTLVISNEETLIYFMYDIIRYQKVDEPFMRKYKNYIDWSSLSKHQNLREMFIIEFLHRINIRNIQIYQVLSEKFISDHFYLLDQELISEYQILSEKFIESYINILNLYKIGENTQLSQKFIIKYRKKLNIQTICRTQNLEEETIKILISDNLEIDFSTISWRQNLSNSFIFEYFIFLDLDDIAGFQKLSESLMSTMWKFLNKDIISYNQRFSFNFFRVYKDEISKTENTKKIVKNGHRLLTLQLTNKLPLEILLAIECML
jgi:hypothetical protein